MASASAGLLFVWHVAGVEASAARHATIKPGHLFIALCKVCDLPLREVLGDAAALYPAQTAEVERDVAAVRRSFEAVGLDVVRCRRRLRAELGTENARPADGIMHRSDEARAVFARAEELADLAGDNLRPVHLLLSLCEDEGSEWAEVTRELGVELEALREAAAQQVGQEETRDGIEVDRGEVAGPGSSVACMGLASERAPRGLLEAIGRDLTSLARQGRLRPTIGRRQEILRLGQILLQQERNNAILVGEAGVGKTRIVEGLAQRLASESLAPQLQGKRIVEVSMASLVAGTQYRGQFEERLRQLVAEASRPEIILFLDEIHTMMGAGQAEGQVLDAANILKPALARGELRVIGATTPDEFARHIERDAALMRRFEVVWVDEPSREEAIEVLQGLLPGLCEHHGLQITPKAVSAAVDLSIRYIHDRRLPDKAAHLLDATCSHVRLRSFTSTTAPGPVTARDVAATVAEQCGVPVEQVGEDEATRLLAMADFLRSRVKGQDQAVEEVAAIIRTARLGLRRPDKPWAVLLFVGPTGVGKTLLAKTLAEFLFGSQQQLIRLDMSEFSEAHSVARLVGAPPGYVGHDDQPQLTAAVRRQPFAVILLDEIEKAHPDVHRLFLQVFDEGRLTDARGRHARFTDTVIIMTSNLGAAPTRPALGFQAPTTTPAPSPRPRWQQEILQAVRDALSIEFLNRIDRIIFFQPLSPEAVREIIDCQLQPIRSRLAQQGITLHLDAPAYELLMREGYSQEYGARAMERAISHLIAEPLSQMLLIGDLREGTTLLARAEDDHITFRTQ